ncbi:unnamed protein product [Rodentolepis nana]|uniref:CPSF_A domain-containing protein n=1 Tax=Rodentolepis nana TaxID=102285 RepID=A0A0R3TYX3_RODNA|nr:unnamed protein product [Rodentolepis nana]
MMPHELGLQNVLACEIACIDITPFSKSKSADSSIAAGDTLDDVEPEYAAVGLWLGHGVCLLKLPSLEQVFNDPLPKEIRSTGAVILPRSIAIAQFDELLYLFCVSGDGTLFYYNVDYSDGKISLRDRKSMKIGSTCQVRLVQWNSRGKRYVFLCSNRPYIIYENRHKLVFANVNIKDISYMAPLNNSQPNQANARGWGPVISGSRICMITPKGVTIGSVDCLQKLHVRKIPIYETPRRIVLQEDTSSIGVLTMRQEVVSGEGHIMSLLPSASSDKSGRIPQTNCVMPKMDTKKKFTHLDLFSLLIFCHSTWELKHIYRLAYSPECYEAGMSLCSSSLGQESGSLYVLGTAFVILDELESKKGRIHILRWDPKVEELQQIGIFEVLGSPNIIRDFNGRLVAGIGSSVRIYNFSENKLTQESVNNENIVTLYLRTHKDYILVGDIMRSCTLLKFKAEQSSLEVIARHNCPRYISALEMFDEDHFITADMEGNVQLMGRYQTVSLEEPVVPTIRTVLPMPRKASSPSPRSPAETTPGTSTSSASRPQTRASLFEPDVEQLPPSSLLDLTPRCTAFTEKSLVDHAFMNTGQSINIFVKGNMTTLSAEHWDSIGTTHTLYASTTGCLGMMVNISPILFVFLKEVEERMKSLIRPFGGLSQEVYRACRDCLSNFVTSKNIIDGELIETFLELNREDKEKIVKGLQIPVTEDAFGGFDDTSYNRMVPTKNCTVGDLTRVVEELAGLH